MLSLKKREGFEVVDLRSKSLLWLGSRCRRFVSISQASSQCSVLLKLISGFVHRKRQRNGLVRLVLQAGNRTILGELEG